MTTHFLVEFPQIFNSATEVYNQIGQCLPRRARMDDRRKSRTVLQMDRATFDSVRNKQGSLSLYRPHSPWPVANVDFEAHDKTLHPTAEACLEHELKVRFGVASLDELEQWVDMSRMPNAKEPSLADGEYKDAIVWSASKVETKPFTPISAIESALKAKGQTVEQIAEATSLHVQDVNSIVTQNPHVFKRGAGGRIFLLPQDQ